MKALPATVCLLLVGCAGIFVQPDNKTVEWESEQAPRGEVDVTELIDRVEYGRRSDGVVVWRVEPQGFYE